MKHRPWQWLLLTGLMLFGLGTYLQAQVDAGSVVGRVTDSSRAVVPGAKVILVNTGTGRTLTRLSQADGLYSFDPVLIGTYSIEVSAHGFGPEKKTGIVVQIDQHLKVNFILKPGSLNQAVEVQGTIPQLQTEDATVGQAISSRQVNDLPLAGRNYTMLAQISAGVTKLVPTRGMDTSGSFEANGLSTVHNDYVLDGIDNNTRWPPSPSRQEGDRRRRGREIRNDGPPSASSVWRFSPVAPKTGAATNGSAGRSPE